MKKKVCCESHGGPVGLHCNHDHCTGPRVVYEAKVIHDSDGDTILEFPDEVMEQLGWEIGDTLEFDQDELGNITISKK